MGPWLHEARIRVNRARRRVDVSPDPPFAGSFVVDVVIASTGSVTDGTLQTLHSSKDAVLFEVFDGVGIV